MTSRSNPFSVENLKPAVDVYLEVCGHEIVIWSSPDFIEKLEPCINASSGFAFRDGNFGRVRLFFPPTYDPIDVANAVQMVAEEHMLGFAQDLKLDAKKMSNQLREIVRLMGAKPEGDECAEI